MKFQPIKNSNQINKNKQLYPSNIFKQSNLYENAAAAVAASSAFELAFLKRQIKKKNEYIVFVV